MKPVVADEMFPEGIDIEEVSFKRSAANVFICLLFELHILDWRHHVGPSS